MFFMHRDSGNLSRQQEGDLRCLFLPENFFQSLEYPWPWGRGRAPDCPCSLPPALPAGACAGSRPLSPPVSRCPVALSGDYDHRCIRGPGEGFAGKGAFHEGSPGERDCDSPAKTGRVRRGLPVSRGKKGGNACKKGVSRLFFLLPCQAGEQQGTSLLFISSVRLSRRRNAGPIRNVR